MKLDRWIAFIILCVSLAYAYNAYFIIDHLLPPFALSNPIWPSTFPKIISIFAIITSLVIILNLEKGKKINKSNSIDYRNFDKYKMGQAFMLIILMVSYALLLKPLGFLLTSFGFIATGALILGERKLNVLLPIAASASFIIWYLVDQLLGVFLQPWPFFI